MCGIGEETYTINLELTVTNVFTQNVSIHTTDLLDAEELTEIMCELRRE